MKKYFQYIKYLTRHIWFVRKACWAKGLYYQGLVHDLSKWMPVEFFAYVNFFHGDLSRRDSTGYYKPSDTGDSAFERAWLHHVNFNPHHWQY